VSAGASSDPSSIPGLAHFTEHMCFLGSQDYPGENEYKAFLSKHGGRSNASTSMSSTTFKFDIPAEHFEQALDIFSAFFACPLFTESCTAREVNAVDSENSKNMSTDNRRRLQILKAIADQSHHYSKFSTGNKLTLYPSDRHEGDENIQTAFVRQALLAFHKYHYTPDNYGCCLHWTSKSGYLGEYGCS
jgi:insulysin